MTIDASQELVEQSQSLTSPIVINDKMLSQSAVLSPFNTAHQTTEAKVGQKMPRSEQKTLGVSGNFSSDALTKILMDLNTTQEYDANVFLLK